ncbi:MAG TPA: hypothetical protein VK638_50290 [Edaphobacter sp.]|nr:hypothetical protein [Edaphobacter sp.]
MRITLFFAGLLLFGYPLVIRADTLKGFLVPSGDQLTTPLLPGSNLSGEAYLSEPEFQGISLPITFNEFMLLEGTIDTTNQEPAVSNKFGVTKAIKAVPETSTRLLVATGLFGACALGLRRCFVQPDRSADRG